MSSKTGRNLKIAVSFVAVVGFLSLIILIGQVVERNFPLSMASGIVFGVCCLVFVLLITAGAFYDVGKAEGVREYQEREEDRKRRNMP